MYNNMEKIFSIFIKLLAFISIFLLVIILMFMLKESFGLFYKISISSFVFGSEWQPLDALPKVCIKPFLAATVYVSSIAVILAIPLGVGFSIFISVIANKKLGKIFKVLVNVLAGIPSVVYGFIGLSFMVKFFEVHFSFATGESVLCAAVLLSIMILPCIVSNCAETISNSYDKYETYSKALGVSKWYMINNLIIPAAKKSILASTILATGRAMGETMAVMMVIGNSPIMPKFFGKGETIPALIALEMGSAQIGSVQYHALFACGVILMILLLIINAIFYKINRKIQV